MHKYTAGMHKRRVRVTSDYLLYLEIGGQEVRRSEVRDQRRLHLGGRGKAAVSR